MELLEQKINELIVRLEALQKNPNHDFNRLREKIDAIEYDYSKLEEEYYELREREEALLLPMDYIEDRLLCANALIIRICDENGLEYADNDEDDDGIIRVPLENKEDN
jgi:predicted  nucleic acid-binding Zn-ribbon protein